MWSRQLYWYKSKSQVSHVNKKNIVYSPPYYSPPYWNWHSRFLHEWVPCNKQAYPPFQSIWSFLLVVSQAWRMSYHQTLLYLLCLVFWIHGFWFFVRYFLTMFASVSWISYFFRRIYYQVEQKNIIRRQKRRKEQTMEIYMFTLVCTAKHVTILQ